MTEKTKSIIISISSLFLILMIVIINSPDLGNRSLLSAIKTEGSINSAYLCEDPDEEIKVLYRVKEDGTFTEYIYDNNEEPLFSEAIYSLDKDLSTDKQFVYEVTPIDETTEKRKLVEEKSYYLMDKESLSLVDKDTMEPVYTCPIIPTN